MTITLGTNIPSYSARMQLNKVSDSLTGIYQKLSTGSRINSAVDDSAGLVISQNMQAKIDGSKQALKNIQTAKSFLTIAEDGMVSISDHFQRINDLLTNMANDTNDIDSRTATIREVIERLSEIDRLARSTNFNGMNMLDGSVDSIIVQMSSEAQKDISTIDISKALTSCHVSDFKAELPDELNPDAYKNGTTTDTLYKETFDKGAYKLLTRTTGTDPDTTTTTKLLKKNDEGKYVYATPNASGEYTEYVSAEGDVLDDVTSGYTVKDADGKEKVVVSDGKESPKYYVDGKDENYTVGTLTSKFNPVNEVCRKYMDIIQKAISQLSTQRGLLGAYENRMESSYESLTTRIESLESAKIPYTDTDIAQEATNMTKNQILQQINVAVLANANQSQQLALSLLG